MIHIGSLSLIIFLSVGDIDVVLFSLFLFPVYWWAVIESGEWDPPIPYTWFIATAFINLGWVTLLPLLDPSKRLLILIPWFLIFSAPFLAYIFSKEKLWEGASRGVTDAQILDIAKKYRGILTLGVIVRKTKTSLEEAEKCLKRFVKHEEAKESKEGDLRFYYFPSIIEQLGQINKEIIKLLLDNPSGLSKTDLLVKTDLSPESIKEALNRLGQKGIIYYDEENNIYKLTGITSTTNKERTAK